MKNLIKIILLHIFVFFYGCREEATQREIFYVTSIYTNKTSETLKIISYKESKKYIETISPNQSLIQKDTIGGNSVNAGYIIYSDSVAVIFGEQKISTFNRNTNSRFNFLSSENLVKSYPNEGTTVLEYSFTNEDIQNAEPCNGNCD